VVVGVGGRVMRGLRRVVWGVVVVVEGVCSGGGKGGVGGWGMGEGEGLMKCGGVGVGRVGGEEVSCVDGRGKEEESVKVGLIVGCPEGKIV